MATWQGVNVNTGQTELPKENATGVTVAIYTAALTAALAANDVILGPVVPAGVFLENVKVDVTALDSNGTPTITFEAGTATTPGQFIKTGNTTAQTGGIASANVPGTLGTTFAANTPIQVKIVAGAATPAAGTMIIAASYTASP